MLASVKLGSAFCGKRAGISRQLCCNVSLVCSVKLAPCLRAPSVLPLLLLQEAYERMTFREALKTVAYDLGSARDVYRFACGPEGMNKTLLLRYIEVRSWEVHCLATSPLPLQELSFTLGASHSLTHSLTQGPLSRLHCLGGQTCAMVFA